MWRGGGLLTGTKYGGGLQFWGGGILGENRVGKLVKSDSSRNRADILCTEAKQQHASKPCGFSVHERVNTH